MIDLDDILSRPTSWLSAREEPGIVISSRIRLARNLARHRFPDWADEEARTAVWREAVAALDKVDALKESITAPMSDLGALDRQILFERNLISREHAEGREGAGICVALDERFCVMINEEDHLRLQGLSPNLDLEETWARMDALDNEIESRLSYAYDANLGYLTACPSNVGTGMRASVMLHLPGLSLMKEMNPIIKGMGKIGLAVRGLGGEGSEAMGNMYQVSNQITLGQAEADIVANLRQIVEEIVRHEQNARARLRQRKPEVLENHVGRAFGILTHAHLLASKEALDLLSGLRLGVDLELIRDMDTETVDALLLRTRPAHLQKEAGRLLKTRERDVERAKLVRSALAQSPPR